MVPPSDKKKSNSPPPREVNQDLKLEQPEPVTKLPSLKKTVVRKAREDGFFKTGVDVIEQEEYEFEAVEAADALKAGKLSA